MSGIEADTDIWSRQRHAPTVTGSLTSAGRTRCVETERTEGHDDSPRTPAREEEDEQRRR